MVINMFVVLFLLFGCSSLRVNDNITADGIGATSLYRLCEPFGDVSDVEASKSVAVIRYYVKTSGMAITDTVVLPCECESVVDTVFVYGSGGVWDNWRVLVFGIIVGVFLFLTCWIVEKDKNESS